jgi:hypothetical protein
MCAPAGPSACRPAQFPLPLGCELISIVGSIKTLSDADAAGAALAAGPPAVAEATGARRVRALLPTARPPAMAPATTTANTAMSATLWAGDRGAAGGADGARDVYGAGAWRSGSTGGGFDMSAEGGSGGGVFRRLGMASLGGGALGPELPGPAVSLSASDASRASSWIVWFGAGLSESGMAKRTRLSPL